MSYFIGLRDLHIRNGTLMTISIDRGYCNPYHDRIETVKKELGINYRVHSNPDGQYLITQADFSKINAFSVDAVKGEYGIFMGSPFFQATRRVKLKDGSYELRTVPHKKYLMLPWMFDLLRISEPLRVGSKTTQSGRTGVLSDAVNWDCRNDWRDSTKRIFHACDYSGTPKVALERRK